MYGYCIFLGRFCQCSAEEFRIYDQALNESYRQLMQRLDPAERRNLREAQRAWMRYRDA